MNGMEGKEKVAAMKKGNSVTFPSEIEPSNDRISAGAISARLDRRLARKIAKESQRELAATANGSISSGLGIESALLNSPVSSASSAEERLRMKRSIERRNQRLPRHLQRAIDNNRRSKSQEGNEESWEDDSESRPGAYRVQPNSDDADELELGDSGGYDGVVPPPPLHTESTVTPILEAHRVGSSADLSALGTTRNSGNRFKGSLVFATLAEDDPRTKKIQRGLTIGLILLVIIVGVSVSVALTTSGRGRGLQRNKNDNAFFEQVGMSLNGDLENGQFGRSISMNDDGSHLAIADLRSVQIYHTTVNETDPVMMPLGNKILGPRGDNSLPAPPSSEWEDIVFRAPIVTDISANGKIVAVGWPLESADLASTGGAEIQANEYLGLVRVYQLVTDRASDGEEFNRWEQLGESIFGLKQNGYFGASLSLSEDGTVLAIAAPGLPHQDDAYVQVFHLNATNSNDFVWEPHGIALGANTLQLSVYSVSLSSSGRSLAVGGTPTIANGVVAKVYDLVDKNVDGSGSFEWIEKGFGDFTSEVNSMTSFQAKLSGDGNTVVLSNYFVTEDGANTGLDLDVRAFYWSNDSNTWRQLGKNMHAGLEDAKAGYMISLSSNGRALAMGDPESKFGRAVGHAHIFRFEVNNNSDNVEQGDWIQIGPNIWGEASGDQFGYAISISGNGEQIAVAAPWNRGTGIERGRVQIFRVLDK